MFEKVLEEETSHIVENTHWTLTTLATYLKSLADERDRTYQQRWEASQNAITAALVAQEKAVAAAFNAQKEAVASALSAADRAVGKAEDAATKRFESVNEFRGQLSDQVATFLPRIEFDRGMTALTEKLESSNKSLEAKIDVNAKIATERYERTTEVLNEKMDTLHKGFSERLDDLRSFRDTTSGRSIGLNAGWAALAGLVSLLIGVASVIVLVLKK
jgi:hypothetical protein